MDVGQAQSAAPMRARFTASLGDLAAIAGWIGALTIAGAVIRPLVGASTDLPAGGSAVAELPATDIAVFAATVLPTGIYLTVSEASARQATWGKRRAALRVVAADRGRAGLGRIALRNAVKPAGRSVRPDRVRRPASPGTGRI